MSGNRDLELRARIAADPSDTNARLELARRMLLLAANVAELTWRDDGGEHSGTDVVEATVTEAFSHLSAATITRLLDAATGPAMSDMITEIADLISNVSVTASRDPRSDTGPATQPSAAPAYRPPAETGGHDAASPADERLTVSHSPGDDEGFSVDDCEFERPSVSLADVAGLDNVKQMINVRLLAPVRNPDKAARFGRLPSGGLLMWGAPGCGKTFIARALAGSLDVDIYAVGLDEVLSKWLGQSERHLASLFAAARRRSPCVLFFDEVDVLGGRRSRLENSGLRGVVSQFLTESDGATKDNTGVFMIGATNLPWEVDPAMRRPGRFDRTLFVPPPDFDARLAILAGKARRRPARHGPQRAPHRPDDRCPFWCRRRPRRRISDRRGVHRVAHQRP